MNNGPCPWFSCFGMFQFFRPTVKVQGVPFMPCGLRKRKEPSLSGLGGRTVEPIREPSVAWGSLRL